MEYTQFKEAIKTRMEAVFGDEGTIVIQEVEKNNGIRLDGLSVRSKDINISPTIYLNSFYKEYQMGKNLDELIEVIVTTYLQNKVEKSVEVEFFTNYENVKNNIVYKLINFEKNEQLLKEVPYVAFLDLAIVFYCVVSKSEVGNATILIKKQHLALWNVDVDEIFRVSKENAPRLLMGEIRSMEEIMREMFDDSMSEEVPGFEEWRDEIFGEAHHKERTVRDSQTPSMYVLSNKERINGAACILYENVLSDFAKELDQDLYILPSSVHEVIIVPDTDSHSKTELEKMVKEVNETQVEPEEILSNSVYFYSKTEDRLFI